MEANLDSTTSFPLDDPIDDVITSSKRRVVKKPKKSKPVVEPVAEYKSKWDQFCDYTSLIGFRLLNSKLPMQTRIVAASIMIISMVALGFTASGAIEKFFALDTAKLCQFFLINDLGDDVNNRGAWEVLPEMRFCHGSQFAQAGSRPIYWQNIVDDVRLLLHLHYTNGFQNASTVLPLTDSDGPFANFLNAEMPKVSGDTCKKWYMEARQACKTTRRGRHYCDVYHTAEPSELLLPLQPDSTYVDYTTLLRQRGPCFLEWLLFNDPNNPTQGNNNFYCCRLKMAFTKLVEYNKMNFTDFLNNITIAADDHVVVSHDELYNTKTVWTSQYGECLALEPKKNIAKFEMHPVEFMIRTNPYDQIGVDGIFAMLVVDGMDANFINVFPGTFSVYYVKERVRITDYSCSDGYPGICSDLDDNNYSIQTCRSCYAARRRCTCYNPLQRGTRREGDRECSPIDAVQCAVNTTNINIPLSICPFACKASTYTLVSTVMNIKHSPNYKKTYQPFITHAGERAQITRIINRLIVAIDNTTIAFPGRSHTLWEAVEFLTPHMDAYFNFIRKLVTLAYGNDSVLIDTYYKNISFFKIPPPSTGSITVDAALRTFWQDTHEKAILTSVWKSESLKDPMVVLARSFEATIFLAKPLNPPAIVNYYISETNMNNFVARLGQLCRSLQLDHLGLSENQSVALDDIFNSYLFTRDSCDDKDSDLITSLRKYIRQNNRMSVAPEHYQQNYAVLNFDISTTDNSVVEYNLDYTFWYFLTDVGGMVGLFFGMTLVTLYEMVSFAFIDREPPERHARKAVKLTRRTLYQVNPTGDEPPPPLPMIVY